jgi:transposase-like protein
MSKSVLSADHFHDEAAALAFIEARLWPNGPVCPKCGETTRVGHLNAKGHKIGMCKCYICRKPFSVTNKTVMESSHIPLHVWLQGMHLMCTSKKGISTNQLHRMLGITVTSAWFLSHRIREAMAEVRDLFTAPMGGKGKQVEIDETFIGGKPANRPFDPILPKQTVVSLVERDGAVRSFHIANVTANNLHPIIGRYVSRQSQIMTDESKLYLGIGWNFAGHSTVNHSEKEYVRAPIPVQPMGSTSVRQGTRPARDSSAVGQRAADGRGGGVCGATGRSARVSAAGQISLDKHTVRGKNLSMRCQSSL